MNTTVSIALLAGGIVLILFGVAASDSLGSGLSRMFTGNPTDRTLWLLTSGIVIGVVGLVGLLRSRAAK